MKTTIIGINLKEKEEGLFFQSSNNKISLKNLKSLEEINHNLGYQRPDFIFSDTDSLELLWEIKKLRDIHAPIILFGPLTTPDQKEQFLKLEIFDWILSPISEEQLSTRLKWYQSKIKLKFNDPTGIFSHLSKENIGLTQKEEKLLTALSFEPVISKLNLFDKVWVNENTSPRTMDVHLANLRKKIGPLGYKITGDRKGIIKFTQFNQKKNETPKIAITG